MKTRKAAVAAVIAAVLVAGCDSGPSSGKVTRWQWTPPTVQTVNVSCSWWADSGSSSNSKYGSSGSGTSYCISWNTANEPDPQDCKITFASGGRSGTADLDVGEAQCRAFLGQQYPPGGTASS